MLFSSNSAVFRSRSIRRRKLSSYLEEQKHLKRIVDDNNTFETFYAVCDNDISWIAYPVNYQSEANFLPNFF